MAKEIERKFLIEPTSINWVVKKGETFIKQGYIYADMDKQLRIRLINKKAFLCLKNTKKKIRDEYEYKIPFLDGKEIYNNCEMTVEKKRITIKPPNKPYIIDVDRYPNGLMVVEVEFKNIRECEKFVPLNWFGKEITGNKKYSNILLSKQNLRFNK